MSESLIIRCYLPLNCADSHVTGLPVQYETNPGRPFRLLFSHRLGA
jgi:hypothetical protein